MRIRVQRPSAAIQRQLGFQRGIVGPSLLDPQDMPLGHPCPRYRLPRNAFGQGLQHLPGSIEVLPGKRLSYQKHAQRAEHWVVVQGTAKVTLDDRDIIVTTGQAIDIGIGSAHRVENPGDDLLVFIEVQRGSYLGEDDIVRLQDDFGRAGD